MKETIDGIAEQNQELLAAWKIKEFNFLEQQQLIVSLEKRANKRQEALNAKAETLAAAMRKAEELEDVVSSSLM